MKYCKHIYNAKPSSAAREYESINQVHFCSTNKVLRYIEGGAFYNIMVKNIEEIQIKY